MMNSRYFMKLKPLCSVSIKLFRQGGNVISKRARSLRILWIPAVAFHPFVTIHAFSFGFSKNEENKENPPSKEKIIIEEADELYSKNEIQKLYDYLVQYKDLKNDEILWRLARAACDKGKLAKNSADKKLSFFEAFEYVKEALALNDNNYASHKWYAILLDYTAEYEGTKQRISVSFQVKEHFLKAIELNPSDATSIYSIGYWCFMFADMPWYTRKIASALFATPPTSTYEEALKYFEQAEETEPNFYSMNLLMLGKTYLRLKNNEKAIKYLKRAKDYPVRTPDDQQACKEAIDLLKQIGIKED